VKNAKEPDNPPVKVFFGDEGFLSAVSSRCHELEVEIDRPNINRITNALMPDGILSFSENTQSKIAVEFGESAALICSLYVYDYKICRSGHIAWLNAYGDVLHRRMMSALDATQLSYTDIGMGVRNIAGRSLRWYKKRSSIDEEDYFERMEIQDTRYLSKSAKWMEFLDNKIGELYFFEEKESEEL
jgi:hypothetical protein